MNYALHGRVMRGMIPRVERKGTDELLKDAVRISWPGTLGLVLSLRDDLNNRTRNIIGELPQRHRVAVVLA